MRKYGLQMFSVRDLTDKDMEGALQKVAALGYHYIEFAGFFGHSAQEIRSMLDRYGLEVSGTHTGWQELLPENIETTIAYHKTIGNKNIIVPGADLDTLEKIKDFATVMNRAGELLAEEGIRLGYHNHSHEFTLRPWGSTIHSELEKRLSCEFEIDTFWAFNAGIDPLALLDRLADRISVIHLKDGFIGGRGMSLGEGEAPVAKVWQKAIDRGLLMVVESETLTPTGIEEVGRCIRYLQKLENDA